MPIEIKERDKSFDQLKLLLILLVTLFHAIEPFAAENLHIFNSVYVFHMPLFILISGYFIKFSKTDGIKSILPLVDTYVWMCIIITVVFKSPWELINPSFSNWFLLSLIFWRIISCFILPHKHTILNTNWGGVLLLVSTVTALISFCFLPHGTFFSAQRSIQFFPFYVLGLLMQNKHIEFIRRHTILLLSLGLVGLICLSLFNQNVLRFVCYGYLNIKEISITVGADNGIFMTKISVLFIGTLICIALLSIKKVNNKLARFGKNTLFLYFFQMVVVQFPARCGLFPNVFVALLYSTVMFGIGVYLSTFKWSVCCVSPITYISGLIKNKAYH